MPRRGTLMRDMAVETNWGVRSKHRVGFLGYEMHGSQQKSGEPTARVSPWRPQDPSREALIQVPKYYPVIFLLPARSAPPSCSVPGAIIFLAHK
jgi:hypothetical protein